MAVGVGLAVEKSDMIAGTHRAQGHTMAKGVRPEMIMAELFGKASGINRGKGRSMHYADPHWATMAGSRPRVA